MKGATLLIFIIFGLYILNTQSQTCDADEFWNGQGCFPCQSGCRCTSYMGCDNYISCLSDQIFDHSIDECIDCPSGCSDCTLTLNSQYGFNCSACYSGFQLLQNVCISMNDQNAFYQPSQQRWQQYNIQIQAQNISDEASCTALSNITGLCIQCESGSFMNEYGLCEFCVNYCSLCSSRGTCQQCENNYYWGFDQQTQYIGCIQCPDEAGQNGVATCNSNGQASSCLPGFQLISGSQNECQSCITPGCSSCPGGVCTLCDEGYYLSSSQCFQCIGNSLPGFMTCSSCSNSTTCTTCSIGYQLAGTQCKVCTSNCLTCQAQNGNLNCTQCNSGYYLNQGICTSCTLYNNKSISCSMINSNITVTQCQSGYLLVNNTCVSNINQCYQMVNSTGKCTSCYTGYLLVNSVCQFCPLNCATCSQTGNYATCSSCNSGYYPYYTGNNNITNCRSCPLGCFNCTSAYNCATCEAGYYLSSGKCLQCDENCQTCNSQGCQTCFTGSFSYTQNNVLQCYPCPLGCANCQSSYGQTCTTCSSGFYPKGSGCYRGSNSCAIFNSDGSCSTCQYGFRLSAGMCLPCVQNNYGYVCGQNAECTS